MPARPDANVYARLAEAMERDWSAVARPSQLPPLGGWTIWLLMAGRGFGKTRSGAEWVRGEVEGGRAGRVALVGPTAADCRDVMIEGESGILAVSPSWNRPVYEPSKRRLTWPSGAIATAYSAEEPERLRGPQHDLMWADELAAWRFPECWDLAMMGLRLGRTPRCVVTTTPKPNRLVRDLLARDGADVAVTRGSTNENAANLSPAFLNQIIARYAGTRLGRQELDAELLEDTPGALWTRALLDGTRVRAAPQLKRVVVAIDPSTTSGEEADETGIVVAGLGADGHGYVIADISGRYTPTEWARRAIDAYRLNLADRIVAEKNQGGEMIEATLRAVDPTVPVKLVHASRGKVTRAEPVSALFEQGRCHVVGVLVQLEDECCNFTTDFDPTRAGFSPGRLDAMVWAFTELMMGASGQGWIDHLDHLLAKARGGAPPAAPKSATTRAPAAPNFQMPFATNERTATPAAARVSMRSPRPWMHFAPAPGVHYSSDGAGRIHDVDQQHVNALVGSGCWQLGESPLTVASRSQAEQPATVRLRGLRPYSVYQPMTGTRYTADAEGFFDAAAEHVIPLLRAGCTRE